MLKKDSYGLGALVGLVVPLALFWILFGLDYLTGALSHPPVYLNTPKLMFLCTALNIIPFRYYFISIKCGKTGRAILLTTVIMIIAITIAFR
ncbi:MAG: hypothetical protein Q8867_06815 [Bacteroidota bacterium]|nr:hypothetical protein [Bacteroidota bacterium]